MNPLTKLFTLLLISTFSLFVLSALVTAETITITPAQPLVLSTQFFTETIGGTGSAIVDNGTLQSFNLTGTYAKEYNDTYKIGPYTISALEENNKAEDIKLSLSEAIVNVIYIGKYQHQEHVVTGAVTVYRRPFFMESGGLIGSETPSEEVAIILSWNGTTLTNTTTRTPSTSTNAYYSINGSNPKTITTNTRLFLTKDNVGEYVAVYTQEEGTVTINGNELSTNTDSFTAHFTGLTLQNGTLKKNNETTPLSILSTPTYGATVLLKGTVSIMGNDSKGTILYTPTSNDIRTIISEAKRRGRYYQCRK